MTDSPDTYEPTRTVEISWEWVVNRHKTAKGIDRCVKFGELKVPHIKKVVIKNFSFSFVNFCKRYDSGCQVVVDAMFREVCFNSCHFTSLRLVGCTFYDVIFTNCTFVCTDFLQCKFLDCTFENCQIQAAFKECTFGGGDDVPFSAFVGCNAEMAEFLRCDVRQTLFKNCEISRMHVNETKFTRFVEKCCGIDARDLQYNGNIDEAILARISAMPVLLDMAQWVGSSVFFMQEDGTPDYESECGTQMCRAGHAVDIVGGVAADLVDDLDYSYPVVAAIIYANSYKDTDYNPPSWFGDDFTAIKSIALNVCKDEAKAELIAEELSAKYEEQSDLYSVIE